MNLGSPAEGLVDFTGGVHICVQLSDTRLAVWELMYRAGRSKSLMGCGTQGVKLLMHESNSKRKKATFLHKSLLFSAIF